MDKSSHQSFSFVVRKTIKRLGKSQLALAKALDVSPAYISQVFSGKKNPPDLGRPRNRKTLRIWSEFLEIDENELVDLVRHDLHKAPLPPSPKFPKMRTFMIKRLHAGQVDLIREIRLLPLHPAEQGLIRTLAKIYLINRNRLDLRSASSLPNFEGFAKRMCGRVSFVDRELLGHFASIEFTWSWQDERDKVNLHSDSEEIKNGLNLLAGLRHECFRGKRGKGVPLVGYVSVGEGFEYSENGYSSDRGFEIAPMPPGVDSSFLSRLYCVKIKGNSFAEFLGDGALLFVKQHSWDEIIDGDLVIQKDVVSKRAFLRKIEFSDDNLILKSMSPLHRNVVKKKSELILFERVLAVVF